MAAKTLNTFPGINQPYSVEALPGGKFLLAGAIFNQGQLFTENIISSLSGEYDSYLAVVDGQINLLNYEVLEKVLVHKVKIDAAGNIFAAGQNPTAALSMAFSGETLELTPQPRSMFVAKFSSNLTYQWSNFFGSTGLPTSGNENYLEGGYDLDLSESGKVYLTGLSKLDHFVIEVVLNLLGRPVLQSPWQPYLKTNNLLPGMYILILEQGGKVWAARPFIKK